jgi:F0F1-type ATP synthase membrane subunit c/vacuolar-type H+-ATPase subunit K
LVFSNAIQAMARQPETAAQTRTTMFLGFALIEALVFITFVLTFII